MNNDYLVFCLRRKSQALSALDEIASEKSGDKKKEKEEWQPPNFRKKSALSPEVSKRTKSPKTVIDQDSDEEKENDRRKMRPKSPSKLILFLQCPVSNRLFCRCEGSKG
jgi:flagellar motility protein MotE (MotC chaperone)